MPGRSWPDRLNLNESMSFKSILAWIVVGVLSAACGTTDEESDIVATVGTHHITQAHLEAQLRRFYMRTGQAVNLTSEVREAVLDARIERYTIVELAREQGWAFDADAVHNKSVIERKILMEEYQRRFIHDRVQVAEADVRELFNRFNTSLRASHIRASTRDEADSLYALIQAGADFGQVARSRFKSPDLARSGGDLGYFTVDEMDIAFEDMAFRMKVGEVSRPVATSTGYSIIKLTDRLTLPILTETQFAEKAESLTPLALEQKRELATRRDMREHIARFRFDEAVIRRLWRDVGKDPEAYAAYRPELNEIPLRIEDADRNLVIARDGRFSFTVGQWMEEAWFTPVERRQAATTFSDFREQVEAMAYRRFAMELLRHHPGLDRSFVDGSVAETFYSYLFDRFERQMDAAISVQDHEIRAEWDRNGRSYIKPMEYNFQELMVADADQAERVVEQLRSGTDFKTMLNRYGLNMDSKKRGGELGFIPVDQFGAIQTRIADVRPGQIVGPFQLETNRFVIFRLLDRRDARPMTFGEAAPVIRAGIHRAKRDEHRSKVLSEARSRHKAVIHYSKLHSITFEL